MHWVHLLSNRTNICSIPSSDQTQHPLNKQKCRQNLGIPKKILISASQNRHLMEKILEELAFQFPSFLLAYQKALESSHLKEHLHFSKGRRAMSSCMPNQAILDKFVGHLCFLFNFKPSKNASSVKINIISYTQVPDFRISALSFLVPHSSKFEELGVSIQPQITRNTKAFKFIIKIDCLD